MRYKIIPGWFLLASLMLPTIVVAQPGPSPDPGGVPPGPAPVNPSGAGGRLENPLGNTDLMGFLQDILDVIMVFAIPLIVFMIIYAGFLFVMDRGSGKNLDQAKRALLYAVIGGVIILGANIILYVIQGTVDAFRTP